MRISTEEAVRLLISGQVVALPTETVYGLAASLECSAAIDAIFQLKGRPANNPLIIHTSSIDAIIPFLGKLPSGFRALAEAFWPGPMTLVLPVKVAMIPVKVRANLPTAAFRIPQHPLVRRVLELTGPLVMPSANLSGKPSATAPEHVETDFGDFFPILDGGACKCGLESTILIYQDDRWKIIRQGSLAAEIFAPVLGVKPDIDLPQSENPLCPGQLYRHYAPNAKLKLVREFLPEMRGVVIGYAERMYPGAGQVIVLGSLSSPEGVAENLYRILRHLDQESIQEVWVDIDVPNEGLWKTILERLFKAAKEK